MTARTCSSLLLLLPGCILERIDRLLDDHGATDISTTDTGGTESGSDTTAFDTSTSTTGTSAMSTGSSGGSGDGGASTAALETGPVEGSSTGVEASTGGSPVCGDGVVAGEEECDDHNQIESDGCLSDCRRTWTVFVTSEPYTQADLKGLTGADYQCRHRATKMFLPNGERYRAWLSTTEVDAADRLYHARGPYLLLDGTQVAASWDALLAGPLDHPIDLTELGETINLGVFTGTLPDGLAVPKSSHCDDWTDNNADGINFGWFGVTTEVDKSWTFALESHCGSGAALYCFEQP